MRRVGLDSNKRGRGGLRDHGRGRGRRREGELRLLHTGVHTTMQVWKRKKMTTNAKMAELRSEKKNRGRVRKDSTGVSVCSRRGRRSRSEAGQAQRECVQGAKGMGQSSRRTCNGTEGAEWDARRCTHQSPHAPPALSAALSLSLYLCVCVPIPFQLFPPLHPHRPRTPTPTPLPVKAEPAVFCPFS